MTENILPGDLIVMIRSYSTVWSASAWRFFNDGTCTFERTAARQELRRGTHAAVIGTFHETRVFKRSIVLALTGDLLFVDFLEDVWVLASTLQEAP